MWAIGSLPAPDGAPPVIWIHLRCLAGVVSLELDPSADQVGDVWGTPGVHPDDCVPERVPSSPMATVPDHWRVTHTATISASGLAAMVRLLAAAMAAHH